MLRALKQTHNCALMRILAPFMGSSRAGYIAFYSVINPCYVPRFSQEDVDSTFNSSINYGILFICNLSAIMQVIYNNDHLRSFYDRHFAEYFIFVPEHFWFPIKIDLGHLPSANNNCSFPRGFFWAPQPAQPAGQDPSETDIVCIFKHEKTEA